MSPILSKSFVLKKVPELGESPVEKSFVLKKVPILSEPFSNFVSKTGGRRISAKEIERTAYRVVGPHKANFPDQICI
jgi:hypothetical protein